MTYKVKLSGIVNDTNIRGLSSSVSSLLHIAFSKGASFGGIIAGTDVFVAEFSDPREAENFHQYISESSSNGDLPVDLTEGAQMTLK